MSRITTPEVSDTLADESREIYLLGRRLDAAAKSSTSVEELTATIQNMGGKVVGKLFRDPDSGWSGTVRLEGYDISFPAF